MQISKVVICNIVLCTVALCFTFPVAGDVVELTTTVDQSLIDANGNGQADSADTVFPLQLLAGNRFGVGTYRSFLEFDISGLDPTTLVNSATFRLESGSGQGGIVDVHGYVGDGTVLLSDYVNVGTTNQLDSITGVGFVGEAFNFDVTDYVQSLVSNDTGFVGIMVRSPDLETTTRRMVFYATEFLPLDTHPPTIPMLTLDTTAIPEPASFAVILVGAIACQLTRRRRQ